MSDATVSTVQSALFRGSSTSFVLTALAVVDMAVIYTGLMRLWVGFTFHKDLRAASSAACKIHICLTYLFRQVRSGPS